VAVGERASMFLETAQLVLDHAHLRPRCPLRRPFNAAPTLAFPAKKLRFPGYRAAHGTDASKRVHFGGYIGRDGPFFKENLGGCALARTLWPTHYTSVGVHYYKIQRFSYVCGEPSAPVPH
jgi:hypothetical protein